MTDWNAIVKAELAKQGGGDKTTPPLTGSVLTEIEEGGESPDFMTQVKLGIVNDPQTMIKIAASSRFPNMPEEEREKRYGIHKGELVYTGEDGKLYYETPDTVWSRFKRGAVQTATDPSLLMGTAGAVAGGIPSVVLGAMGGEVAKKNIQASLGQKDAPISSDLVDFGVAGAEAAVGEGLGRGLAAGINKIGAKRGGTLAEAAGRDRTKIDLGEVQRLEDLSKDFGIDLYPPSTTGSKRLADKWKLLGDLPETADLIQGALKKTTRQVEDAFTAQLDKLASPVSSLEAGTGIVNASRKAIKTVIGERRKVASPLYEKAFKTNTAVDIEPLVSWVDDGLSSSKADIHDAYTNIRKILTKPDLPKEGEGLVPYETNLKGLHDSLVALNQKVETSKNPLGELTPVGKIYNDARKGLRKMLRDADGNYAQAMDLYREGSEFVEEVADSTLIGMISNMKGDKRARATQLLFSGTDSNPATVARAKSVLVDKMGMGDEWNKALRYEMERQFESIKGMASSDVQNLGGLAAKKINNRKQAKIWQAAMSPDQYETWQDFFEVLDKTKLIFGRESMTTPRQFIAKEMEQEGSSIVLSAAEKATGPKLLSFVSDMFGKANEVLQGRYNKELAESLLSEQAHQQLKAMKQLPPGSNKLLGDFMGFLALAGGQAGERQREQSTRQDSLPLSMRPTLKDLIERRPAQ